MASGKISKRTMRKLTDKERRKAQRKMARNNKRTQKELSC